MLNFSAFNFGCRLNQAELSRWIEEFKEKGLFYTENYSIAEFIIVHTCTLTGKADADIRKFIRKIKRENPGLKIVIAGCMVHTHYDFFDKEGGFLILDNKEKNDLVKKVLDKLSFDNKKNTIDDSAYLSRGFLKIADGCNFRCSYCIIPYIRGDAISIPEDKIIENFKKLIDKGYQEIVITGVNIAYYRMEQGNKEGFLKLLEKITKVKGDFYLRLTSLDSRFLNNDLIEFMVNNKKIGAHFHISIQNGSEKILKEMGRYFPPDKYLEIMEKLDKKKDVLLSADYIVGFVGEGDKEFKEGFEFLKKSPLNYLHIFRYSPRKGTSSYYKKHPPERDAKQRYDILKNFHNKRYEDFKKKFIDKKIRGIIVGDNKILTENYISVSIDRTNRRRGMMINVKIEKTINEKTFGKIIY
jgi:threonylcarbamoyladenosine tRNA methylthiotransferase MtaB